MRAIATILALAILVPTPRRADAQTATRVVVRVVSHDAKIIGSAVGGARVIVRDPATGRVLADGVQEGGTGSTKTIMVDPVVRGTPVYDSPGAAAFTASLEIDRPTVLEFVGQGPLGYPHAMQRAAKSLLVVPGQDIVKDGVILELHGLIVELLAPDRVPPGAPAVEVSARVRMLCGCPLEPGGLWDADRVRVVARVVAGARVVREVPLAYAGEPTMFRGDVPLTGLPSGAHLVVAALDPSRVNFGQSTPLALP